MHLITFAYGLRLINSFSFFLANCHCAECWCCSFVWLPFALVTLLNSIDHSHTDSPTD